MEGTYSLIFTRIYFTPFLILFFHPNLACNIALISSGVLKQGTTSPVIDC